MTLRATTSQTVGPFFSIGLDRLCVADLAAASGIPGERIEIYGRVLDGDGKPVPDALIEIWQANAAGKYAHPEDTQDKPTDANFLGYGRVATDDDGSFLFKTVKPGRVPGPDGKLQAPHIVVSIFCRGLLARLVTRIYFPDAAANAEDLILNLVDSSRRHTLVATPSATNPRHFDWNVILQGSDETVFFDI